jgi:hypothetical protein
MYQKILLTWGDITMGHFAAHDDPHEFAHDSRHESGPLISTTRIRRNGQSKDATQNRAPASY